jgi:hypothetical protein
VLRSDGFSDRFLQVSSPTIGAAALKPGGLAQVYGLARQSGGGLRIKSSVGQGTTAEVYLPRSFAQGETGISGGTTNVRELLAIGPPCSSSMIRRMCARSPLLISLHR